MIRRDSLYRRLLSWLMLPMVALGGLMLFQAWLDARQTADRAFDRLLEASTLAIAEQVQWQDGRLWLDLPPAALEMLATDAEERVFYAIYDDRGHFVTGNADLPGVDAPVAENRDTTDALFYQDIRWHDLALRLGVRRTHIEDWRQRERFEIRVAHTREGRQQLAEQLLRGNLMYIFGMALLAAITLFIAIRSALAPLTRLRRAIRARDPRTLSPLELPLPRELAELRETLNELLARMRRVRANQERFIGDASHQLRTPLAGLSARAELALRQDDPAQWHQALSAMHETSARTSRLAMQLLSLTRLDNPEYQPELATLDLGDLARRLVKRYWSDCHRQAIDLGAELPATQVMVSGLDWQLEEAVTNLVDNSRRYGATRITVRVSAAPPQLEVEDDGPGIPATKQLLMLRPFHRHSEDPDGSGLGLTIVDGIARSHGARLGLADGKAGQGLRVTLTFPEGDPA
ncbi:sensor histidine kinase [Halomonas halmophila]|uniref:histidine kinase n=1 Tax=Halomonas halmophila TaxID=252 RepID=A0A4Y4F2U1_9GAMM|nr:sensor histidine kinase N-terminal domain-containing protein [Halomonas halmophila]GED21910.1 sensor histidine kinase [Halomonas halmophila]